MTEVLRKDAARNRDRLLTAGRELFAQRGLDASLNDVAHHAGVGVGTAYRRFANKEELIDAIWLQQLDELETILHDALSAEDPWEGLVTYLEGALAIQAKDRGIAQLLSGRRVRPDQHDSQRDTIAPLVNQVAARARDAGVVRNDLTGTDLIFLQIAVTAISGTVTDGATVDDRDDLDELYRRYLWIALDGLRPTNATAPLPVPALTTEQTHLLLQPKG